MKAGRFYALCAEQALAEGRPLGPELRAAGEAVGRLPPAASAAAAHAEAGRLDAALAALEPLGFDPLLAEVARLKPEAVALAGRRLRELPSAAILVRRFSALSAYLLLLLAVQGLVGWVLTLKVLPTIFKLDADFGLTAPAAARLVLSLPEWLLGACAAMAVVALVRRDPAFVGGWLRRGLAPARVMAVAAAAAEAGLPASEALARLSERHPGVATGLAGRPVDAATLRELSLHLSARMRERAERLLEVTRVAGSVALVATGAALAVGCYLAFFNISALGGAP